MFGLGFFFKTDFSGSFIDAQQDEYTQKYWNDFAGSLRL